MRGGYILIEASVTLIILSLALVTMVPLYMLSVKSNTLTEHVAVATQLAVELLEEVKLRKWDQTTPSGGGYTSTPSAIGIDAGENAADKTTFNDVDDFNGWSESPPKDPMGNALSAFSGYTRTVLVEYVDSSFNTSASATDYKHVKVCVSYPQMNQLCLETILTNR